MSSTGDGARIEIPPLTGGTKHDHGRALIVGGSRETPGAVVLAAGAALRVGAGVVQIGTASSAATAIAVAVPEVRVVPLEETGHSGAIVDDGRVEDLAGGVDAVLVGSGTSDRDATRTLLAAAAAGIGPEGVLIVDAAGLDVVEDEPGLIAAIADRVVLMPNPNEAARLVGRSVDTVTSEPGEVVTTLVDRFATVVALRGDETWIGAPDGSRHCHRGGHPLLGVAGSGDVLAGVLVGLAARGGSPWSATVASVVAHARVGEVLAATGPRAGYLARELLDVLPAVVEELLRPPAARGSRAGFPHDAQG